VDGAPSSVPKEDTLDGFSVVTPPALLSRLGVEPAASREWVETLRLPGRVSVNEHHVARIGPSVTGRVTDIQAFIGQSVKKGERLALINSTELSAIQSEFLKSQTRVSVRLLAADRARRLHQEGILSQVTLKERESELSEAEVELRAARDQLAIMGMSEEAIHALSASGEIKSITPVTATLTGNIIERHVSIGQIAQPSDDLFTVADLSQVWVVAEAPEQKAYLVEVGGRVEVDIPALPHQKIVGKVIQVSDIVNPATRTVTVRMELPNPQRRIKPEMLATMVIHRPPVMGLGVPSAAVVRVAERDHVFVQTGDDRFELTPVSLGPEQDGYRRVLEGLKVGQRIVVDGAFHLNNERIRKELE
jgi:cobalt-zinc-cadmium efflux system membrane fusion protein